MDNVVSSVGPVEYAGHGIEVYSNISRAEVRDVEYTTSPKGRVVTMGAETKDRRKLLRLERSRWADWSLKR